MKIKTTASMAAIALAGLLNAPLGASAAITTTGFGTPPGIPVNGYSGSGIPTNTSEWTQVSGIPNGAGPTDTLTVGLAATQHDGATFSNPAPGNDGAGTYTAAAGLVSGRSTWNVDFYINSALNPITSYTWSLTELNVGNGLTVAFNPLALPDNVDGPSGAGNSESDDFAFLGLPIAYNANLNDTYDFSLTGTLNGSTVVSDDITVIIGSGAPVPEPSTVIAGALLLLPLGLSAFRLLRKRQTA